MIPAGVVTAGRVTHESGTVDDLAAASPDSQQAAVAELCSASGIDEAYVLSTCNRVEAYVVASDPVIGRTALSEFFAAVDDQDPLVITDHDDSLTHLLRVATGLESVVLGEDQIIGQVRTAYEDARAAGGIGTMLEPAVTKAIHVGERARTETKINEGIVSLGSAATQLAGQTVSLEGATALVVGAGEMGQLAARSLADAGVDELVVSNRTVSRAEHLISDVDHDDTRAVPLESLDTLAARADVIVAATGSDEPVVCRRHFVGTDSEDAMVGEDATVSSSERVVVDLGQPRDVDPTIDALDAITVYDLDDLETITEETRKQRADAAREVEAMIDREFDLLCDQYKRARADEVIGAMYESAAQIKQRELETALSQLEGESFTPAQREVVEAMADALVNQLLAPPTRSLREAAAEDDWSTINTALQLFDPDFGDEDGPSLLERTQTAQRTEAAFEATDDD
ncbi:glutamyl-tRNA reductase [Natrialba magadii ATCC 43099]|uniref:Glutamyl-tRNA reductase n=1 Tax=Natrialba magadii (strain ATCC 43099 / DSM 3394 / CCM 3739 / CIP 104546 / IAM 13178 / JCM 8861 / NBRC 102185 / NCIMB 2190 / MS3) TaxID=547559 RepID=D3SS75_NATMM|nr:glutamyl-tRNA reductase [Natrialba magadii]ADD04801.1 glutamyl-tRNA reductase [Natrialba magadii ATCC 43099]ELY24468.1 glutamyl-tRNA reductase [Natrialba magadii ATCC 43099]